MINVMGGDCGEEGREEARGRLWGGRGGEAFCNERKGVEAGGTVWRVMSVVRW